MRFFCFLSHHRCYGDLAKICLVVIKCFMFWAKVRDFPNIPLTVVLKKYVCVQSSAISPCYSCYLLLLLWAGMYLLYFGSWCLSLPEVISRKVDEQPAHLDQVIDYVLPRRGVVECSDKCEGMENVNPAKEWSFLWISYADLEEEDDVFGADSRGWSQEVWALFPHLLGFSYHLNDGRCDQERDATTTSTEVFFFQVGKWGGVQVPWVHWEGLKAAAPTRGIFHWADKSGWCLWQPGHVWQLLPCLLPIMGLGCASLAWHIWPLSWWQAVVSIRSVVGQLHLAAPSHPCWQRSESRRWCFFYWLDQESFLDTSTMRSLVFSSPGSPSGVPFVMLSFPEGKAGFLMGCLDRALLVMDIFRKSSGCVPYFIPRNSNSSVGKINWVLVSAPSAGFDGKRERSH